MIFSRDVVTKEDTLMDFIFKRAMTLIRNFLEYGRKSVARRNNSTVWAIWLTQWSFSFEKLCHNCIMQLKAIIYQFCNVFSGAWMFYCEMEYLLVYCNDPYSINRASSFSMNSHPPPDYKVMLWQFYVCLWILFQAPECNKFRNDAQQAIY